MILFALKYWKIGAGVGAILFLLWYRHSVYEDGRKAGEASVKTLWQADTARRDKVDAKTLADNKAFIASITKSNSEAMSSVNQSLISITSDRDSLGRMYLQARDQIRSLSAGQATSQLGINVAAGIAARASELEKAFDAYDTACQRDAIRFDALQRELRPQL